MDVEAQKSQLVNQQAELEQYLQHPVTIEVLRDCDEQQERLLKSILNDPITNLEAFFNREQALGHLRGIRQFRALLTESLEDVKEQIKGLE